MTYKDLNEISRDTQDTINLLMSNKQKYYVKDETDAFENFNDAISFMPLDDNETMPQVAIKYMRKHWVKLFGIIFKKHNYTLDLLNEIINDIITYLILIKAMLIERHNISEKIKEDNKTVDFPFK